MKPLIVQFSGGRTSGFMARFLQLRFPDREIHYLFQNTGKEHEKTLEFVLKCDREWDLRVVWLEAVVHDERKSSTYKVVDFESASRNGEPFEQVLSKYGLVNQSFSHCTRELKMNPSRNYIKNALGLDDYEIAIGIRADESHRINRKTQAINKLIYPLTDIIQVNKSFINDWWSKQSFDLDIPAYLGNCDMCFKKSIKTLTAITREQPERLLWWEEMESKYSAAGAVGRKNGEPLKLYRGNRTAQDLRELAETPTLFDNPEFEIETDCFCKST